MKGKTELAYLCNAPAYSYAKKVFIIGKDFYANIWGEDYKKFISMFKPEIYQIWKMRWAI